MSLLEETCCSMVEPRIKTLFQPELLPGEQVLWTGQPDPAVWFRRMDLVMIPLSLIVEYYVLVWTYYTLPLYSVLDESISFFLGAYISIIVFLNVIGLYFVFGRFLHTRRKKRLTFYALTNSRALVLSEQFGRRIDAVFLNRVATLNKTVRRKGRGTMLFGSSGGLAGAFDNSGLGLYRALSGVWPPAFYDIEDVDQVFGLALEQRSAAQT